MKFYTWLDLNESNIRDLYRSTVNAFPRTRKRQHSVHEISLTALNFVPYQGVRTLFVKGSAYNDEKGTAYNPMILFKNVKYHSTREKNLAEIVASNGRNYFLEKLKLQQDVVLRCNCQDFYWRFNYEDYKDRSLYGTLRRKYEAKFDPGSTNPLELPGMCKHLIKLAQSLNDFDILEG
jgi:hypothetical protein